MKKPVLITLLIIQTFLIVLNESCKTSPEYNVNRRMELKENWSFRMKGESDPAYNSGWLPAEVPGCVHTDLIKNNKIPQPFYRNNEKQLQWIDKNDWIYQCTFQLDSLQLKYNKILLNFKGLDTYARVKLNNQVILESDNMFRSYEKDVSNQLISGDNILEIVFTSPITVGLQKLQDLGYGLPAVNDQSEVGGLDDKKVSVFTRKAPYQFGWDWGPRFVTSGIWRPIELVFIDKALIKDVYYKQSLINTEEAVIDAVFEIDAFVGGKYQLDVYRDEETNILASTSVDLQSGINSITVPFTIPEPELWWPNGMGNQYRYKFKARLSTENVIIDTLSQKIGLRSVELIREPDSLGTGFYFRVNGRKIFAKGANYIPNDNFLNRVTVEKYQDIVQSAAESNMNMLRVWGGGIYENDIFYDLCDKYGILVWQDFMFACSMYPGDNAFLENVKQEAIENVIRLRNHSSIVLWCGNNEIDAAWCEGDMNCGWNWKQQYTPKQRKTIWHNYDTLFHKILPDVIENYDQTRAYWPSSPQADWNEHAGYTTRSGDMHYWGVWHGNEPFSSFYKYIGRFMSEYGFQSLPEIQTIKKFTLPHDWDFESEVLSAHQRSGYGNSRILEYMEKLYPVPDDFNQLLYVGQVMQAEAIKSAIQAHRANKPYCMGSLYWQLNDCWPGASWSGIDYYLSWKALQYFAKKAFAPVSVSFFPDEDTLRVYLNSDLYSNPKVQVHIAIKDFSGDILSEDLIPVFLETERAIEIAKIDMITLGKNLSFSDIFLQVDITEGEETLASDIFFFEIPRKLNLPETDVSYKVKTGNKYLIIDLSSDKLAKNVFLWIDNSSLRFSDNYFDLLPGEKKSITLPLNGDDFNENDIHILTLNAILNQKK